MGRSCIINLPIIKSAKDDFCNECGANFPPGFAEGICKDWETKCLLKQLQNSGKALKDWYAFAELTDAVKKTAN